MPILAAHGDVMRNKVAEIWSALATLSDPEIPVITLHELGILRDVREGSDGVEVVITPTYSGCPAMEQIHDDIISTLAARGLTAKVVTQLYPAWTTDWMDEVGKEKLRAYGIAPPQQRCSQTQVVNFMPKNAHIAQDDEVACPHCGSENTVVSSYFGSTACKALYKCLDCQEPFDYFKPY